MLKAKLRIIRVFLQSVNSQKNVNKIKKPAIKQALLIRV